ncbi:MAG: Asp-tRNA(Asn)/Glu-tRNA(Gln) amidotransferase subunit GatB [Actinobacteria bacterium]|nr:Asp-tRNA(Asn)/Glu-tRNA(Gln) amidotransferase subunit GatB [Actinomycetota bacterium]
MVPGTRRRRRDPAVTAPTASPALPASPAEAPTSPSRAPAAAEVLVVEASDGSRWELVCGLEVHAELLTETKMFSGAPNRFGGEPNTHIDPVTLGLPGSLPVLNRTAVELAMRFGLAVNCEIRPSVFARKNYFYPDMPKDYQISQYDRPICADGWLDLPSGHRVGIERAHLEEDTGKSTHVGGSGRITGAEHSLVDYNRAGVPLLEIVSRPDIRTAEQAREYVGELRAILVATAASDGKMEEGSMRVDANVSVRPEGAGTLGTRCEIKNLNSLRSLGRAIEYEARRQAELLAGGERVRQETRHWDESDGRTHTMRSKEEAEDYRYFPEPDLVPLAPEPEWIDEVRASLPVLPAERRARLAAAAGVDLPDQTVALVVQRAQDDQALAAIAAGAEPGRVLVHVSQNLAGEAGPGLAPERLAALVALETAGRLTATQAKSVLAEMLTGPDTPEAIAAAKGFEAMDATDLAVLVDEVVAAHPAEWHTFVTGDEKARGKLTGFFVGQLMKASKGRADGRAATALLRERAADAAATESTAAEAVGGGSGSSSGRGGDGHGR